MTIFEKLLAYAPVNAQEASDRRLILQYAEQFGNLFTRENEMAHLTASCWIVNPSRTKALLAYHNIYDSWAWLGGHADGMEDLLAVACKEANEESGISLGSNVVIANAIGRRDESASGAGQAGYASTSQ